MQQVAAPKVLGTTARTRQTLLGDLLHSGMPLLGENLEP